MNRGLERDKVLGIKNNRLILMFDCSTDWMLYFLFAYIEAPPIDQIDVFDAAHDRAMGSFSGPNELVEYLVRAAKPKDRTKYVRQQGRWHHFHKRYERATKQELLEVLAFFLGEKPGQAEIS